MMDFGTILEELIAMEANPAVPAGLPERVLERVWVESMERRLAAPALSGSEQLLRFDTVQRVRAGRSLRSTSFAVLAHLAALLLLGVALRRGVRLAAPVKIASVDLVAPPPVALVRERVIGGGGGQKGPTPATKGTPPKFAEVQIVPPMPLATTAPKIVLEPTIEVQHDVKMVSSMPQIGVANAPLVGLSMGSGRGTGLGDGYGSGLGSGSGGNTGGGPKRIGGGVSAPVVVFQVEPEFSEEARRAKAAGNVLVNLWVDTEGNPSRVHVVRGVGMGLDEKAVEAVKQYRFKPAMENGKPVLVELNIDVTFQIF